jgi:hypothetical protein
MSLKRPLRVQVYRDRRFRWRYRYIAGNHQQIGKPEQGFMRRSYAEKRAVAGIPAHYLLENGGPGYIVEG